MIALPTPVEFTLPDGSVATVRVLSGAETQMVGDDVMLFTFGDKQCLYRGFALDPSQICGVD